MPSTSGRARCSTMRSRSAHIRSTVMCGPGIRAPIVDLDSRELVDARREREDVAAAQRRHRAAGRGIVPHRDRAAGEEENDHPQSTLPPFTFRISPVMCRARSEQRNTIGPAMSRGAAMRPIGMPAAMRSRPPFANGSRAHLGVDPTRRDAVHRDAALAPAPARAISRTRSSRPSTPRSRRDTPRRAARPCSRRARCGRCRSCAESPRAS